MGKSIQNFISSLRLPEGKRTFTLLFIFISLAAVSGAAVLSRSLYQRKIDLKTAKTVTNQDQLSDMYEEAKSRKDIRLLEHLAKNPVLNENILADMYTDYERYMNSTQSPYHPILVAVAWNPNTPAPYLDRLAHSPANTVRVFVARNDNALPETLNYLSRDEDYLVRLNVCHNPNVSHDVLKRYREDPDMSIQNCAQRSFN